VICVKTFLQEIYNNVVKGEASAVQQNVQAALDANIAPDQILNQAMIEAMQEVGALFERQEYYLPEMLMAAQAMHAGLDVLRPSLVESGVQAVAKVAIGTVQGDMHDIGKNLVAMMLEGAGFEMWLLRHLWTRCETAPNSLACQRY
jgi:5-methyltetrahydrofolate--homocysteine methyltransferase